MSMLFSPSKSNGFARVQKSADTIDVKRNLTADNYTLQVSNQSNLAMTPQLFKGFISSNSNAQAVAWKFGTTPIKGSAIATANWSIQYCVCWGQLNGSGGFTVTDSAPCNLGDLGSMFIDPQTQQVSCNITPGGGGVAGVGSVSVNTPKNFPLNWYTGFGVMLPGQSGGQVRPAGVAPVTDNVTQIYTPQDWYSVNFQTAAVDYGLYSLQQIGGFGQFNFDDGTHNCVGVFDVGGNWNFSKNLADNSSRSTSGSLFDFLSNLPPNLKLRSITHIEFCS